LGVFRGGRDGGGFDNTSRLHDELTKLEIAQIPRLPKYPDFPPAESDAPIKDGRRTDVAPDERCVPPPLASGALGLRYFVQWIIGSSKLM